MYWGFLNAWVLHVAPALVPLLGQMRKLVFEVLQSLYLDVMLFVTILLDPTPEEELFQANEHSSFLEILCIFTLLLDLVELL